MFFWCEKGTRYGNQSCFFGFLDDVRHSFLRRDAAFACDL